MVEEDHLVGIKLFGECTDTSTIAQNEERMLGIKDIGNFIFC
jgi:hypothetical protein